MEQPRQRLTTTIIITTAIITGPSNPRIAVKKFEIIGAILTTREVVPGRVERPTKSLGNSCSIHLSYGTIADILP